MTSRQVVSATTRAALLLLCAAAAVRAQTTGSIEGRITDSSGALLPGVTVEATSPNLQGIRSSVTQRDGSFRFPAVAPGDYVLRAHLEGFRPAEKAATVSLGATATVNLVLQLAAAEQVVVSGEAPLMDTTSTTTGTNYTSHVITHLPVSRNYADIVRSNPGRLDGPRRHAGTFARADDLRRDLGREPVDHRRGQHDERLQGRPGQGHQQRVRAGGRGQDRRLSGRVRPGARGRGQRRSPSRAATSSTATPSSTTTRRAPRRRASSSPETRASAEMRVADGERFDYGADLGGFLLKDRLWFFGAYNRVDLQGDVSRVQSSTYVSSDGPVSVRRHGQPLLGKADLERGVLDNGRRNRFRGPLDDLGGGGSRSSAGSRRFLRHADREPRPFDVVFRPGAGRDRLRSPADPALRLAGDRDGCRARTTRTRTASRRPTGSDTSTGRAAGGTPEQPCDPPEEPHNITGGYGFIAGLQDRQSLAAATRCRADVTFYAGNHEIKAGADYLDGRTDANGSFTGEQAVQVRTSTGSSTIDTISSP